jgi:hypothetical protein
MSSFVRVYEWIIMRFQSTKADEEHSGKLVVDLSGGIYPEFMGRFIGSTTSIEFVCKELEAIQENRGLMTPWKTLHKRRFTRIVSIRLKHGALPQTYEKANERPRTVRLQH